MNNSSSMRIFYFNRILLLSTAEEDYLLPFKGPCAGFKLFTSLCTQLSSFWRVRKIGALDHVHGFLFPSTKMLMHFSHLPHQLALIITQIQPHRLSRTRRAFSKHSPGRVLQDLMPRAKISPGCPGALGIARKGQPHPLKNLFLHLISY